MLDKSNNLNRCFKRKYLEHIRLEQERIPFKVVASTIEKALVNG